MCPEWIVGIAALSGKMRFSNSSGSRRFQAVLWVGGARGTGKEVVGPFLLVLPSPCRSLLVLQVNMWEAASAAFSWAVDGASSWTLMFSFLVCFPSGMPPASGSSPANLTSCRQRAYCIHCCLPLSFNDGAPSSPSFPEVLTQNGPIDHFVTFFFSALL